jgi:hypothetical protein
MLNVPITVNGIHTIFTETGENDSIQRHPITPPTARRLDGLAAVA